MGFADRAARIHAASILRVHGRRREYRRAGGSSAVLILVSGKHEHESRSPDNVVVTVHVDDWLCSVADFQKAFGADAVPEDDDAVIDGGVVYRVRPIDGEPCHRFSDQTRQLWRIHTKDEGADE